MRGEATKAMGRGKHAEKTTSGGALRSALSIVIMIGVVALITVCLRIFVFVPYEIPSGSMEDTIKTGDMVFSEKITYYTRAPEYGDIVTFADPEVAGRILIKRVIATEGQVVDLIDGTVYVDGVALDEPYTGYRPSYPLYRTAKGVDVSFPYTVPDGEIWVMGDNRTSSQDSRYFGSVKLSNVTGRAAFIYWPVSNLGFI